jgi:outer membrane protein OmpA-like peptidoglycan-associated protein
MDVSIDLFKFKRIPRRCGGFLFLVASLCLVVQLTGCASSGVSRASATQVDTAYENSNAILTHGGDSDPADAYVNAPQTTKGVILGATAGAVTGAVSSGTVGILPGVAAGAVLGGFLGAYVDYHTTIRDQLENRGVKVMVLGDQIMLIWPSSSIFVGMTADFRGTAFSTMDLISTYLNLYAHTLVKIAGYTNDIGQSQVNCVISQEQANAVQKYLWKRVNTRVMTARGYGGKNLLEPNNTVADQGINYRIEITVEKLPV